MGQDPGKIRHEVDDARENLGKTVEAIAYKANAPKRLKERAADRLHAAIDRVRGTSSKRTAPGD